MLATPDWLSFAEMFSWRWLVRTTSDSEGSVPGIRASTIAVFFSGSVDDSMTILARSASAFAAPPAPHLRELSPANRSDSAFPCRAEIMKAKVVFSPRGPSSSGTLDQAIWSGCSARGFSREAFQDRIPAAPRLQTA